MHETLVEEGCLTCQQRRAINQTLDCQNDNYFLDDLNATYDI